ncbi:MAG: hypothetical protein ACM37W_11000 [Actinomycetota bacterium]
MNLLTNLSSRTLAGNDFEPQLAHGVRDFLRIPRLEIAKTNYSLKIMEIPAELFALTQDFPVKITYVLLL